MQEVGEFERLNPILVLNLYSPKHGKAEYLNGIFESDSYNQHQWQEMPEQFYDPNISRKF